MTSKSKSEGNLFLTFKKAPGTDDQYDPILIEHTYNEKNSEISLYASTSKTGIKCQHTVFIFELVSMLQDTRKFPWTLSVQNF